MSGLPRNRESARRGGLFKRRVFVDRVVTGAVILLTAAVLLPLLGILGLLLWKGAAALRLSFSTVGPAPSSEAGGGMAHALLGSAVLLTLASLLGVPLGIGAGLYLGEWTRAGLLGRAVGFTADMLNGVPSVLIGLVVYFWVVERQGHFSAFAGGTALAVIMVPLIARTTEVMLRTVPQEVREAAWGLGVARWRTVLSISLRTALPGVITGCMLAFARIAGETAPLLFTAFGNQYRSVRLNEPIAALPLMLYNYALSPNETWHTLAWGGALVLVLLLAGSLGLVRLAIRRGQPAGGAR